MTRDRFGNPVDAAVGYARGSILASPRDEYLRSRQAARLIDRRIRDHGIHGLYNLTGGQARFPVSAEDLPTLQDEAVCSAQWHARLNDLAIAHTQASADDGVGLFNRTSAGIVGVEAALAQAGDAIVSVVPGVPSHPSVRRGAAVALARLVEVSSLDALQATLSTTNGSLVVVTGVSSELAIMPEDVFVEAIGIAGRAGRIVLVDDAYGARLRPTLRGQPAARAAGADLVITSTQKAGLRGPRAGLLVGRGDLVEAALTKGMELGLEARAPLTLGVVRALECYRPEHVLGDIASGRELSAAMIARFGGAAVSETPLGPLIREDDVLTIALARAPGSRPRPAVVPAESAVALAMLLIERYGILTVGALGMPGARVSLRLKTTAEETKRLGGVQTLVDAVDGCFDRLSAMVDEPSKLRELIVGEPCCP